jgi:hypothetical protein
METLVCGNCKQPLKAGVRFCNACGKPVQVSPQPQEIRCPACDNPMRPGVKFCNKCGNAVNQPVPIRTIVRTHPQQDINPVPDSSDSEVPESIFSTRLVHISIIALLAGSIILIIGGAYLMDYNRFPNGLTAPGWNSVNVSINQPEIARPDQQVVKIGLSESGRFGLTSQGEKPLTFSPIGETNNTRLWVDGETPIFGVGGNFISPPQTSNEIGDTIWKYKDIEVTQSLAYVIGASGQGDTIQIKYQLHNTGAESHKVGLRIMIDTLVGKNDGVPFFIPGQAGITDYAVDLRGVEIPESIRAIENPDLAAPGVILNLTLKGFDTTPPDRVLITGWFDSEMSWDFLMEAGGSGASLNRGGGVSGAPDSAVGLFYDPQMLVPGNVRTIITYYGIGTISSASSGNVMMGLFGPAVVLEGDAFYLTAVVTDPQPGETIQIQLPGSLALKTGESAIKSINETGIEYTQVSWLIQACEPSDIEDIEVSLEPSGITEFWSLSIDSVGITRSAATCP